MKRRLVLFFFLLSALTLIGLTDVQEATPTTGPVEPVAPEATLAAPDAAVEGSEGAALISSGEVSVVGGDTASPANPATVDARCLSRFLAQRVVHPLGQELGFIEDVIVDVGRKRADYHVLRPAPFLGIGPRLVVAPLDGLRWDAERNVFVFDVSVPALQGAPSFMADAWPDFTDLAWDVSVRGYWGLPSLDTAEREPVSVRLTALLGAVVRNLVGQSVGSLEDLLIDREGVEVYYMLISAGAFTGLEEQFYVIPMERVVWDREQEALAFDVNKEWLQTAPGLPKGVWPDTGAPGWDAPFREYFLGGADEALPAEPGEETVALTDVLTSTSAAPVEGGPVITPTGVPVEAVTPAVEPSLTPAEGGPPEPTPTQVAVTRPGVTGEDATVMPPITGDAALGARRMSAVLDRAVVGPTGEQSGTVVDLIVNFHAGRIGYALVAVGPEAEGESDPVLVPLSELEWSPDRGRFMWEGDREKLASGPRFSSVRFPAIDDPEWDAQVRAYWGVPDVSHPGAGIGVRRATRILGAPIQSRDGQLVGTILDFMVDRTADRAYYAVLSCSEFVGSAVERLFLLPLDALQWVNQHGLLVIVLDAEPLILVNAPSFDEADWPDPNEPRWDATVRNYWANFGFGVGMSAAERRLHSAEEM